MTTEELDDLITRLKIRASIRRNIQHRKSFQEGKPDRISDLLEEAAAALTRLKPNKNSILSLRKYFE